MLRGLLAHETQMTHLHLPRSGLPRDDLSTAYQQHGGLTALKHLCAMDLPEPKPSDCRTLHNGCNSSPRWSSHCGCAVYLLHDVAEMCCCCLHHVTVEQAVCKGHCVRHGQI